MIVGHCEFVIGGGSRGWYGCRHGGRFGSILSQVEARFIRSLQLIIVVQLETAVIVSRHLDRFECRWLLFRLWLGIDVGYVAVHDGGGIGLHAMIGGLNVGIGECAAMPAAHQTDTDHFTALPTSLLVVALRKSELPRGYQFEKL